ncbi:MAG TPA: hypothetical protein PKK12_06115 [Candidatus Aminicenantes bacterium]|nr:hypothetical protein [Candidatus Aminicenantes bacterium]
MVLVDVRRLDDCLDGARVYSCRFAEPVTERQVRELAAGEKLEYFADFPRPFFRIFCAAGEQVKGVVGDDDLVVVMPAGGPSPDTFFSAGRG